MDLSIRRELARLFPDHPLVEVPLDHPIYHLVYDFPHGLPKIHEHDGKPAQGFGIFSTAGWRSTTPISPTWATGGRIPTSTTIRPRSTSRRSGWE